MNRKTSTQEPQILGFSDPDYKITIFTIIKEIKKGAWKHPQGTAVVSHRCEKESNGSCRTEKQ